MTLACRLSLLLPAFVATACGSIPTRTFEFDALDPAENLRPCLIVINDDWIGAAEKNQVVNVAGDDTLTLTLEFKSAEVEVTVAPLTVEGNTVRRMPTSRRDATADSTFRDEVRRLRLTDPQRQLFILAHQRPGS